MARSPLAPYVSSADRVILSRPTPRALPSGSASVMNHSKGPFLQADLPSNLGAKGYHRNIKQSHATPCAPGAYGPQSPAHRESSERSCFGKGDEAR